MLREKVPTQTATLGKWLQEDREPSRVSVILQALRDQPGGEIRPLLEGVIQDKEHSQANRVAAAVHFVQTLDAGNEARLLPLAEKTEDSPVLAELLRAMGTRPKIPAAPMLRQKLASASPEVRATAIVALADWGENDAGDLARNLFSDSDGRVRAAAAQAAGKLAFRPAADQLVKLAIDPDAGVRRESLNALRAIREPRVIALAEKALADRETVFAALDALGEGGGPAQAASLVELARRNPSADVLASVGKVLTRWADRPNVSVDQRRTIDGALAEIHGSSGVLLAWRVVGPVTAPAAAQLLIKMLAGQPAADSRVSLAGGFDARVVLGKAVSPDDTWLSRAELTAAEMEPVEFFIANTGLAAVLLNGKLVYRREKPGVIGPYTDRFEAALQKGRNVLIVQLTGVKAVAEFQVRFRRKTASADQERYTLAALSRTGNPAVGRELFFNAEKSLCIKCHRIGEQGERIGPELTGVGARFSKIYIVESILQPSRTIAPSFETITVSLKNGKVVSGVKVAETETTITLGDTQAVKHTLNKADIEEQQKQPTSTMPEGTEKRLTEDEFVDLVSFLANLKDMRGR
jgi:putative heme-binding domain-containing protein